ncbi:hypothetical protein XENOCAPTIV_029266 [Xenoophorus captivus]|uniref:Uncharacterized protein n=1 Tax=Xenoophorus captivus TaxID=1517983 RepID=A0ABV0RE43_9TELE
MIPVTDVEAACAVGWGHNSTDMKNRDHQGTAAVLLSSKPASTFSTSGAEKRAGFLKRVKEQKFGELGQEKKYTIQGGRCHQLLTAVPGARCPCFYCQVITQGHFLQQQKHWLQKSVEKCCLCSPPDHQSSYEILPPIQTVEK